MDHNRTYAAAVVIRRDKVLLVQARDGYAVPTAEVFEGENPKDRILAVLQELGIYAKAEKIIGIDFSSIHWNVIFKARYLGDRPSSVRTVWKNVLDAFSSSSVDAFSRRAIRSAYLSGKRRSGMAINSPAEEQSGTDAYYD